MGGSLKESIRRIMHKCRTKKRIKTWVLILVIAVLLPISATLLRVDHIQMTELRDAVLAVDAEIVMSESDEAMRETDAKLADALIRLKEFVFSNVVINVVEKNGAWHVTFGTGPFYLEHQYLRAATRALGEAEKAAEGVVVDDSNPNGNIYATAGEYCRGQATANGWNWDSAEYINCMVGEINKYPASEDFLDPVAKLPSTELYRKNYASPVWAPTLTGWVLLITLILLIIVIMRGAVWIILHLALFLA